MPNTNIIFSKKIEFENEFKQKQYHSFAKIKTTDATAKEILSEIPKNAEAICK